MKISRQLRLLIVVNSACLLLAIALTAFQLASLRSAFTEYQHGQAVVARLTELKATALAISRIDLMLPDSPRQVLAADGAIQRGWSELAGALDANDRAAAETAVLGNWDSWYKFFNSAVQISTTSPQDALNIPDRIYALYLVPMTAELDRLVAARQAEAVARKAEIDGALARLLWVILLPLLVAGGAVIAFLGRFAHRLGRRVGDMALVAEQLRDGQLSQRLPTPNDDEISQLAEAINDFVGALESVVRDVDDAAGRIRAGRRAAPGQVGGPGDFGSTSDRIRRAIAQGRSRRAATAEPAVSGA